MNTKRAVLVAFILSILGISAFLLYIWANQNVVVTTAETSDTAITPQHSSQSTQIDDKYFYAVVPAGYTINSKTELPDGNILSRYVLKNIDQKSLDQLAITIGKLPPEGLSGLSDVMFRSKNSLYKSYSAIKIADKSVEFISENPFELSVFWSHNDKYSAIVISGTQDRSIILEKVITDLVGKWSWSN